MNPGRPGSANAPLPPRMARAKQSAAHPPGLRAQPGLLPPRLPPPKRARRWLAWAIGGTVLAALILYITRSVFVILCASAVAAWLLDRPVTALARRGWSREVAIGIVAGGLTLATTVIALWVLPRTFTQLAELSQNLEPYLQNASARVGPLIGDFEQRFGADLPVDLDELGKLAPGYIEALSPDVQSRIQEALKATASGGISIVVTVLSWSLFPLFAFFLLRDWPQLITSADGLLPVRARPVVRRLVVEIDDRLFGWVRGQLTVAAVLGVIYAVGLLVSGIDLAVTTGLLGGVLFLVPFVGPLVTGVFAVVLCLLKFGVDWHLAVVIGTFVVGQALEGAVLTPWLVGDRVGLHPLVVMVAVIVGGNVLGLVGIVIAVPLTAALAVVGLWLIEQWKESATFSAH